MKSLPVRILSAAVGVLMVGLSLWAGGPLGLAILATVIVSVGAYEFKEIGFVRLGTPPMLRWVFFAGCLVILKTSIFTTVWTSVLWSIVPTAFVVITLFLSRRSAGLENERLLSTFTVAALGFIYCALLPSFAIRMLFRPDGVTWFSLLLGVVFAGDIFAYFGGNFFGKNKLMPSLSPNKTVEGSISGILGSLFVGCIVGYYFLPQMQLWMIASASIAAAVFAQAGDLFESLVKRVAGVKDSGRIMPGHGGVLDRLDGVYFAAPLIFAISQWSISPI